MRCDDLRVVAFSFPDQSGHGKGHGKSIFFRESLPIPPDAIVSAPAGPVERLTALGPILQSS
jgi:hypothetical protein